MRNGAHVLTINEALRLSLSSLIRAGAIRLGYKASVVWKWRGGEALIETYYPHRPEEEAYVRLSYKMGGEAGSLQDYKVRLQALPSNLGAGRVLYFVCPASGRRCRALYLAPGSTQFISRDAYSPPLYYPLQTAAKRDRSNERYFSLKEKIESLSKGRAAYYYSGEMTRRAARLDRLQSQKEEADVLRFLDMLTPKLRRAIFGDTEVNPKDLG